MKPSVRRVAAAWLPVVVLLALVTAPAAHATNVRAAHIRCVHSRHDAYPLHRGSRGCRVRGLQYLLRGNNVFVSGRHVGLVTYRGRFDGQYGPRTARAVRWMKWRLGYPRAYVTPTASRTLYALLRGKTRRPKGWISRAAERARQPTGRAPPTRCAARIVAIARHELGVHEQPWGSNSGWRVSVYQSVTGAYHAAWCASFSQYVLKHAGVGPIADRSAGVGYISGWAYRRGWTHSVARVGSLAAYGSTHIGVVVAVFAHSYINVEGNENNAVRLVTHRIGDRPTAFIWIPGCTT